MKHVGDWYYRFLRSIVRFVFKLCTDWEVVGVENVPPDGPFISVSNHTHWLDPPVIMASLPRRVYPLAADKWQRKPVIGQIMASVGAIFIMRGEVDRRALRQAMEVLKQGKVLGIAPEGTRSKTGAMQRGRSGAAYLACLMGVPLVPVGVIGVEKALKELRRLQRPQVKVVIGPAFTLPPLPSRASGRGKLLREYTTQIMYRIAELLPEEYRGVYR
jgi:1-acyl-sn-glycerol-3-phosphate acyltransferase